MISVPINSNSVHIPIIQTGCCAAEFDSTYPIHLNGIISQYEFQESIKRINQALSYRKGWLIIAVVVFTVATVLGTVSFVIGGLMASRSWPVFYSLLAIGIFMSIFGSLLFSVGMCLIYSSRTRRLREAIAEESMRYSSRSPTPCSWRLDASRYWFGGYGYNNNYNYNMYQLVIDIGNSPPQDNTSRPYFPNKIRPEIGSSFDRQENYAPPTYSASIMGLCSGCGAARHDLSAKYCSSCGHRF